MNLTEYQKEVTRTMSGSGNEALTNWALGLAGECGEVIEPIKKFVFHGKVFELKEMEKELGDVLWYLAAIANSLNLDLNDVIQTNVAKLRARYPDGFKK